MHVRRPSLSGVHDGVYACKALHRDDHPAYTDVPSHRCQAAAHNSPPVLRIYSNYTYACIICMHMTLRSMARGTVFAWVAK